MTKNSDGKTVLNDFLTLGETIGEGGFCKVIKAIGYYPDTEESVPYALKKYKVSTLNRPVVDAQANSFSGAQSSLKMKTLRKQTEDEVVIWGKLKHDNVVKAFIWMEDFSHEAPHPNMYLMMQYADLGEIASWDKVTEKYVPNARMMDLITKKLTEEEEFKQFGVTDCANMHERVTKFIF